MMGNIKGFAWNCGGLRRSTASTFSKVMFFEKTFKNDFDFFFFLETHHKDENDLPNELLRYEDTHHIIHSETNENDTHVGIIGLIRNNYLITGIILNCVSGLLIAPNMRIISYENSSIDAVKEYKINFQFKF